MSINDIHSQEGCQVSIADKGGRRVLQLCTLEVFVLKISLKLWCFLTDKEEG